MTKKPATLTHLDSKGRASMVDVGEKPLTRREAVAEAIVTFSSSEAYALLRSERVAKGDALAVARIAGISAGKRTSDWIPLAHPLPIERIGVEFEFLDDDFSLRIEASAVVTAKTGIEMEAMVAASAAALTIYDMCKAADRSIVIGGVRLLRKSGGRSGDYEALGAARR